MATTDYQAGVDTNALEMSYAPETTWGVVPTGTYQKFRIQSETFSESRSRSRPQEIRSDGQASSAVTQDVKAEGGLSFGLSYGNVDALIAGSLAGDFTTPLAIVGVDGDISAVASTGQITSTTSDKFADVVVGQWLKLSGFSSEANNGYFRVSAKADDQTMTLAGGSSVLVDETPAGAAVSIQGSMLRNSTVFQSFTLQKRLGSGLGFAYPGTFVTGGNLQIRRGQFVSGSLSALCKAEDKAETALGSGFDAAPINQIFNTVTQFTALQDGADPIEGILTSLDLTWSQDGAAAQYGIGDAAAKGITRGLVTISGSIEVYFKDYSLYDKYKNASGDPERMLLNFRLSDDKGNAYIITIPAMTLGDAQIQAGGPNQPVMAKFNIEGNPDPLTGCTMQIDAFPAA